MKTLTLLKRARAKIVRGWCQGALAKTKRGEWISVRSSSAVKWCATGAICALTESGSLARDVAILKLGNAINLRGSSIPDWNDVVGRTQKQVLAVYDKAIKQCEASK